MVQDRAASIQSELNLIADFGSFCDHIGFKNPDQRVALAGGCIGYFHTADLCGLLDSDLGIG